jgi:7-carboxy-7-deazaguanine synthase
MQTIRNRELLITEIFHSIQGEGSHAGLPYVFVRLTGCNLRCRYCDTAYAFKGGTKMTIEEVLAKVREFGCTHVLLTGGEPLLQRPSIELLRALHGQGYEISIETHGEISVAAASPYARLIMDIKTPSSGMCRGGYRKNIPFLKTNDEIKFVIASEEDYSWARDVVRNERLPVQTILFSPVQAASGSPGKVPGVQLRWLAEQIIADGLNVRLQVQLHKIIWGSDIRGV